MGIAKSAATIFLVAIVVAGCRSEKPKESMTSGHAVIGASDAAFDLAWRISRDFQTGNRGAFVDIVRASNPELIDSLLNERSEEVFLDRDLSPAETLAFHNARLRLHRYPVALYPVYLLVSKDNPVEVIDSANFRAVLMGQITNWNRLGGDNRRVITYVQTPGEGSWNSVVNYFGGLDSVEAVVCSTLARMVELSTGVPGALLVYSKPYQDLPFRRLMFQRAEMVLPANVQTIAEEPTYPFRLDITYVTIRNKTDVAAGYLTYATSNLGQRGVMNAGYRPASVPVRVVKMKG